MAYDVQKWHSYQSVTLVLPGGYYVQILHKLPNGNPYGLKSHIGKIAYLPPIWDFAYLQGNPGTPYMEFRLLAAP